jgi:hypothetical protein
MSMITIKKTNSGGNTPPFMSAAEILGYRPLPSLRPPSYYSFSTGGRIMLAFFGMHGHGLDYSTIQHWAAKCATEGSDRLDCSGSSKWIS